MDHQKIYTIDELRSLIGEVAGQFEIVRVFLFGSYARGEATAESDVDLRIEGGKVDTFLLLGKLYNAMEDTLRKTVDIITGGDTDAEFLSAIAEEEVLIYPA